ncbi:MAG TPA: hypothetical protein VFM10_13215 [Terriglobales bacterium]|nr:hypothetical protein [Terriglobales bacterium]
MAATAVVIAILVIFISPITDLLPAPHLKHMPAADLFGSVLLLAVATALQSLLATCIHRVVNPLAQSCDRLELICLRRC